MKNYAYTCADTIVAYMIVKSSRVTLRLLDPPHPPTDKLPPGRFIKASRVPKSSVTHSLTHPLGVPARAAPDFTYTHTTTRPREQEENLSSQAERAEPGRTSERGRKPKQRVKSKHLPFALRSSRALPSRRRAGAVNSESRRRGPRAPLVCPPNFRGGGLPGAVFIRSGGKKKGGEKKHAPRAALSSPCR